MHRHQSSASILHGHPNEPRRCRFPEVCRWAVSLMWLVFAGFALAVPTAVGAEAETGVIGGEAAAVDSSSSGAIAGSEPVTGQESTLRRLFSHRRWLIGGLLSSLMIVALIETWKTAARRGRRFTQGRLLPVSRLCGRIQRRHQVTGFGVVFLASMMFSLNQANGTLELQNRSLMETVQVLQSQIDARDNPSSESLYGVPPIPHRPNHPRRISGVYYRGNCERLAERDRDMSSGNFRTATFHVGVCDVEDTLIDVGDSVSGRELFLRVEMERSPFTDDALYSPQAMQNMFFSHEYHRQAEQFESPPVRFQVLQRGQRWVAYYPLDEVAATAESLSGLVYLYRADESTDESSSAGTEVRYGIRYQLRLRDGQLIEESDVHMGALFCHPRLAIPQPGKVLLTECFSHLPIPEKHASSADDPELLGISEYLEQNSEPQLRGPSAN